MLKENKKEVRRGPKVTEWSKEKVVTLKKLYPLKDNASVAAEMGITESALRNAAVRFRVKKSSRYWDKPWEDFILKNWEVMTVIELSDELKRKFKIEKTKWAVINKYRELKGLR